MKTHLAIICAASFAMLAPSVSLAACPAPAGEVTGSISKDGQTAPLQMPDDAAGTTQAPGGTTTNMAAAEGNRIAKDGSTMPMTSGDAKTDAEVATSGQDVAAQQEGEETAAAMADEACPQ